jgi:DNA-binding PadR family transcriptional regulator
MTVRGVLLSLLAEGDRHGYQLKVDFEERTGGLWPLNVGQVYTTLDRMLRDDAVVEKKSGNPDQRVFGITETGRRELKEWLTTTPADAAPPRDEFVMKVLVAVRMGGKAGLEFVDRQRASLLSELQQGHRELRLRGSASDGAASLASDALLGRVEADIRWLDRCEAYLHEHMKAGKKR